MATVFVALIGLFHLFTFTSADSTVLKQVLPENCDTETFQVSGYEEWRGFRNPESGFEGFPCDFFGGSLAFRQQVCYGSLGNVVDNSTGIMIGEACCICPSPTPTPSSSATPSFSASISASISFTASLTASTSLSSSTSITATPSSSASISSTPLSSPSRFPKPENCFDDDARIIRLVNLQFQGEITIAGCVDVRNFCHDPNYGSVVKLVCPETCNICDTASPSPSPSPSSSQIQCVDNDDLIITLARGEGINLRSGCSDVKRLNACELPPYQRTIYSVCARSCNPVCDCVGCYVDDICVADNNQQVANIAATANLPFQTCADAVAVFPCDDEVAGPLLEQFCPCTCAASVAV